MSGKWIEGVVAATPTAEAARLVLAARLDAVPAARPLAVEEPFADIEHVHRLRVSTRRAAAALEIFSVCLPHKRLKKARKTLKALRRAAAAARDEDVFLAGLAAWPERRGRRERPGVDFLTGHCVARRLAAQTALADVDDFPAAFEACVRPPRARRLRVFGALASPLLTARLRALEEAVDEATDDDALHGARVAGKRLRYAMEVFTGCFGPAFREELYPEVEALQETLGTINDSRVAATRLEELADRLAEVRPDEAARYRPALDGLTKYHRLRLAEARRDFEAWHRRLPRLVHALTAHLD